MNERYKTIDILSTSDLLGRLDNNTSLLASYFNYYKKQNTEGTLIVDAGDSLQGTFLSNSFKGRPIVEIMNHIGYDTMTIGNHEFDWGVNAFLKTIKRANFDILAANIYQKKSHDIVDWADPYTILHKHSLKIGIIGFTTKETPSSTYPDKVKSLEFRDPTEVSKKLIHKLRNMGVDLIFCVGHLPAYLCKEKQEYYGELIDLVNDVNGFDAVVGGHNLFNISTMIKGVPVVIPPPKGNMIGHIKLIFDTSKKQVVEKYTGFIDVKSNPLDLLPCGQVDQIIMNYRQRLGSTYTEVIGYNQMPLIRRPYGESKIGNWITDVIRDKMEVQISFYNSLGIFDDIPEGPITAETIYQVSPFENYTYKGEIKGELLYKLIEQSLSLKNGMLQTSGMRVYYQLDNENTYKLKKLYLCNGNMIHMDQLYTISTNDFLATGGDEFDSFKQVKWEKTSYKLTDLLIENIKMNKGISTNRPSRLVLNR